MSLKGLLVFEQAAFTHTTFHQMLPVTTNPGCRFGVPKSVPISLGGFSSEIFQSDPANDSIIEKAVLDLIARTESYAVLIDPFLQSVTEVYLPIDDVSKDKRRVCIMPSIDVVSALDLDTFTRKFPAGTETGIAIRLFRDNMVIMSCAAKSASAESSMLRDYAVHIRNIDVCFPSRVLVFSFFESVSSNGKTFYQFVADLTKDMFCRENDLCFITGKKSVRIARRLGKTLVIPKCMNPKCTRQAVTRCSRCMCVVYCGIECHHTNWANHKSRCTSIAIL